LKRFGNTLIAITGNMTSFLAKGAHVLNTTVNQELALSICSYQQHYCPTSYGRCSAVCLMEIRDFKPEDFAIYHPGGALGKSYYFA
jgi:arabinose-5-phosphate isomerase